jgi:hypothetical protein
MNKPGKARGISVYYDDRRTNERLGVSSDGRIIARAKKEIVINGGFGLLSGEWLKAWGTFPDAPDGLGVKKGRGK